MSTDRQKSFIGTLSCDGRPVSIERGHSRERGFYNLLVAKPAGTATRFYFRWEHKAYVLYVRDESHLGELVNLNSHGELAVSPKDQAGQISFDLDGKTLDDMQNDRINLHITAKPQGLITLEGTSNSPSLSRPAKPERLYFRSEAHQEFAYFTLNILERNAPYVSHPDEV